MHAVYIFYIQSKYKKQGAIDSLGCWKIISFCSFLIHEPQEKTTVIHEIILRHKG